MNCSDREPWRTHRCIWICLWVECFFIATTETLLQVGSVCNTFLTLKTSSLFPVTCQFRTIWSTISFRLWLLLASFLKQGPCSNMCEALFCLTVIDNISSTDHQFLGILNPRQLLSHANLLHPLGKAYLGNQQISRVCVSNATVSCIRGR